MKDKNKDKEQEEEQHLGDEILIKPEVNQNQLSQEKTLPETESKTEQNFAQKSTNNLDREFGYVSTDYFLKDASESFGEWAKGMTPAGVHIFGSLGGFSTLKERESQGQVNPSQLNEQELSKTVEVGGEEQSVEQDLLKLPLRERLEEIRSQNNLEVNPSQLKEQELNEVVEVGGEEQSAEQDLLQLPLEERLEAIRSQNSSSGGQVEVEEQQSKELGR